MRGSEGSKRGKQQRPAGRGIAPRQLQALSLGVVFALALLLLVEWGFGRIQPDPGFAAIRRSAASGSPFDPRSRGQVVSDLRDAGIAAVPRLVPARLLEEMRDGTYRSRILSKGRELLPLSGLSNRTTVLCNETGRWAIYESDEHGFRNPVGSWHSTPIDLLLVGDSFTIGECVGPGETVADGLRADWPATVNLGYSGNSPLFELATLVEYGAILEPRITLWLFFENDLSWFDLGISSKSPLLMSYMKPGFSQSLADRQPEIDEALGALLDSHVARPEEEGPLARLESNRGSPARRLFEFLRLRKTRRFLARLRGGVASPGTPLDYALFRSILERARDTAASWQGEVVVVFLPGAWQFDPAAGTPEWTSSDSQRRIRDLAESVGLEFIDVRRALARDPDPLSRYSFRGESLLLGSPHMNARGYALTSAVIRDAISRRLTRSAVRSP